MKILLTGGMGFIGSHTAVELLNQGHEVILYDNLSNADISVLDRLEKITGHLPTFIEGDIRNLYKMQQALSGVDVVIHFAGLKAVGESVHKPIEYYSNNVNGTDLNYTLSKYSLMFAKRILNSVLYVLDTSIPSVRTRLA